MGENTEKDPLVEQTVKLHKSVLDFFEALIKFAKPDEPLDELLGQEIESNLDAAFSSNLEPLLSMEDLQKKYELHLK